MIRIEIEGETAADVREQVYQLLLGHAQRVTQAMDSDVAAERPNATAPAADPQQPSRPLEPAARRGRPRKAQTEPPAVSATAPAPADETLGGASPVPEQPIAQKADPTAEDARAALTRFVASKGVDAGRALLAEFITEPGAKIQLPNLKPEQYADFIARCL